MEFRYQKWNLPFWLAPFRKSFNKRLFYTILKQTLGRSVAKIVVFDSLYKKSFLKTLKPVTQTFIFLFILFISNYFLLRQYSFILWFTLALSFSENTILVLLGYFRTDPLSSQFSSQTLSVSYVFFLDSTLVYILMYFHFYYYLYFLF